MDVNRKSADAPEVVEKVAKEFKIKAKVRVSFVLGEERVFPDVAWFFF